MHSFPPVLLKLRFRFTFLLVAVAFVVASCATRRPVPVEDRVTSGREPPRASAQVRAPLPPVEAPPAATYTVKRGDTLHQIALDSGLDYRELAAWNNIDNANRIFPGQVLRLTAPGAPVPIAQSDTGAGVAAGNATTGGVTTAPLRTPPAIESNAPIAAPAANAGASNGATSSIAAAPPSTGNMKTSPKAIKEPYSEQAVRELDLAASAAPAPRDVLVTPGEAAPQRKVEPRGAGAPAPPLAPSPAPPPATAAPGNAADADHLDWAWPAKGKIVTAFSETANLKGIDIAGTAGEPVRASAPGRVVYAGDGLRGYGKLIIIKHNGTYLSAYAHNREILVKEGQQVTRGQKIAEMGRTDADQVKLHFEIRRHGKPIDPTKFLPPT